MDKERNLTRPATFNFKSPDKIVQKDKRKDFPYSIPTERFKKSRFNSPEKQGGDKKPSLELNKIADLVDVDEPDRSFGDFYCKPCNSHMSSEHIWKSHIKGKRHLKTTKRADNEFEFVDQDPIILPELKKVKKPIIGLQHCCEMMRGDGKPVYQCFLCSTSIPNSKVLIEHVIGLKHRMAYLKIHDAINYNIITKAELKKGMIEPLVEEFIQKYQEKHGLGKMRVKVSKQTSSFQNPARPYKDDLTYKKNSNIGKNLYDDVRKESVSENTDWRHNAYDDARNRSDSESPNRRHGRSSYNDVRSRSDSESPDRRHSKNSYSDARRESESPPDWRHSKNSFRNESKHENTNWRQMSGKERDYHSNVKYDSDLHFEKSVRQQSHSDKNETAYPERQTTKQPINSSEINLYSNSTWKTSNQAPQREDLRDFLEKKQHEDLRDVLQKKQQEDLRGFLEKKRMLETNTKIVPNITNAFEFVFSIMQDLPNMKFLELVLQKVQNMKDPSESELGMLSKIGKCMFSIVMAKQMDKLTPDLRKKYQSVTNDNVNHSSVIRTATPEQKSTNKVDFQSLMDLIKNPKREVEKAPVNQNFPLQNVSSLLDIATSGNHQPAYTNAPPNFIPSLWGTPPPSLPSSSAKDFPTIPGLTLPGNISSSGQYAYSQVLPRESYASAHNLWSTIQHKDNVNQY